MKQEKIPNPNLGVRTLYNSNNVTVTKVGKICQMHIEGKSVSGSAKGWTDVITDLPNNARPSNSACFFLMFDNAWDGTTDAPAIVVQIRSDGSVKVYLTTNRLSISLKGDATYIGATG